MRNVSSGSVSLSGLHPTNCEENRRFSCQSRCSADKQQKLWVVVWTRACRASECARPCAAELLFMFAAYGVTVCGNCSGGPWEEAARKNREREREREIPAMPCAKGQAQRCTSADCEIPLASEESAMSGRQRIQKSKFRAKKSKLETRMRAKSCSYYDTN